MTLSLEQKDQLTKLIKKKESQLRKVDLPIASGDLWCKAIRIIISGGDFQSVLLTVEAYPQESLFVA